MRLGLRSIVLRFGATALLLASTAFGQNATGTQDFPLTDTTGLIATNVTLKAVEYKGRKAVLVSNVPNQPDGFALLPGTDFQDGTIDVDLAVKTTVPPGVRDPGFIGIAFRARPDASHYELFYVRPGNSQAQDQAMRNHSTQYASAPDNDWFKLRRQWPFIYESYAPMQPEAWTHVRIEVKGRTAQLFVNGSEEPSLIVNGLKGEDLHGGVALWGNPGEEAYFSKARVTNVTPQPIKNGSDAAGVWQLKFTGDAGGLTGSLKLAREGNKLSGTWSADGKESSVEGTWREGYVDLTFPCTWPRESSQVTAHLAGWIDGDSAQGRMLVEGKSDGPWSATKANSAFIGDWKLNPARSKLTDVMEVESAGPNKYIFNFGGGNETIVVDGTDQPGGNGTTLSVAKEGPDSWKVVRKKDGRMLITANWTLSQDGKTLTDDFTAINADGSTYSLKYLYGRTGEGSGFVGKWVSTSETVNSVVVLQVRPYEIDGLSFISSSGQVRQDLKFDGKDYPNTGMAAGSTASTRRSDHVLEITYKREDKVFYTQQLELSPDLSTLTITSLKTDESEPNIQVFERQ